jgi:NADH:ubiquinone oxidoreductase subunit K
MISMSASSCLILSWILFVWGLITLLVRRNILTRLIAIVLMFNATSLAWVAGVRYHSDRGGQGIAFALLIAIGAQFLIGLGVMIRKVRED